MLLSGKAFGVFLVVREDLVRDPSPLPLNFSSYILILDSSPSLDSSYGYLRYSLSSLPGPFISQASAGSTDLPRPFKHDRNASLAHATAVVALVSATPVYLGSKKGSHG